MTLLTFKNQSRIPPKKFHIFPLIVFISFLSSCEKNDQPIQEHVVTITVKNHDTPVSDAEIDIEGYMAQHTDLDGKVIFNLTDGKHKYSVNAEGYYNYADTLAVLGKDQSVNVYLAQDHYGVTFHVKSGDSPVQGASISIGNDFTPPIVLTTDIDGNASAKLPIDSYDYTIAAERYNTYFNNLSFMHAENKILEIQLTESLFEPVSFVVKDENNTLIENAVIKLNGHPDMTTDAQGLATVNIARYDTIFFRVIVDEQVKVNQIVSIVGPDEIKTITIPSDITDVEGNNYRTVIINNLVWMAENLRTTKYNDDTEIPLISDATGSNGWANRSTPAYCWYDNNQDEDTKKIYGALYNWHALSTDKLCPTGWRIPSNMDLTNIDIFFGKYIFRYGASDDATSLSKILATVQGWTDLATEGLPGSNSETNNGSGFSAFPAGARNNQGVFEEVGKRAYFWSGTDGNNDQVTAEAYNHYLGYNGPFGLVRGYLNKSFGLNVRCVRDVE